jgi:hypothetical protein
VGNNAKPSHPVGDKIVEKFVGGCLRKQSLGGPKSKWLNEAIEQLNVASEHPARLYRSLLETGSEEGQTEDAA